MAILKVKSLVGVSDDDLRPLIIREGRIRAAGGAQAVMVAFNVKSIVRVSDDDLKQLASRSRRISQLLGCGGLDVIMNALG